MKKKIKLPQSTGILFIRWNWHNRVAVAYFEFGEMVFMKIDKTKMVKLCDNFLSKNATCDFISEYPIAIKNKKTNEDFWNDQSIQQNGILELKKTSPIAIKFKNRKEFNEYANHYLK